ncbi:MAG: hypothetical protein JNG53_03950 [Senegalimassilia sp.]|nr:hypothetical protein [Senegalimassilia sp.]
MFDQEAKRKKPGGVKAVAAAALATIAAVVAAQAIAAFSMHPEGDPSESPLASPKSEGAAQPVAISVFADGADLSSCPAVIHISGTTDGNRSVDTYHAASSANCEVSLVPGGYAVEAVPMALPDGRVLAQAGAPASLVVAAGSDAAAEIELAESDGDGAEAEIASALSKAADRGDQTIAGDKARSLSERASSYLGGA